MGLDAVYFLEFGAVDGAELSVLAPEDHAATLRDEGEGVDSRPCLVDANGVGADEGRGMG